MSKVDQIEGRLDELVNMYKERLMTFEEIGKETGIEWWTIKELFRTKGIETISLAERAKHKREKDFDLIHRLHFEEEVGVNELYRKYGFSGPYVRAVLADKGLKPVKWRVNQFSN